MNAVNTEEQIMQALEEVYDPEVGVNIVDLGLVYNVTVDESGTAEIEMTLTVPQCPMADQIVDDVKKAAAGVSNVKNAVVRLVWEPKWTPARMNDKAIEEIRSRQTLS